MQYRQGDVFIQKIARLPKDVKPRAKDKRVILAYGESTGHEHAIINDDVESFIDTNGRLYLRAKKELEVTHQDHGMIVLPKGVYVVTVQREYTPEAIRNVKD